MANMGQDTEAPNNVSCADIKPVSLVLELENRRDYLLQEITVINDTIKLLKSRPDLEEAYRKISAGIRGYY
jgi:hypothetical protein